ncbi:MAG: RDD family protein [Defluviitaleaceae bacterium]|nr:RDD family protein [Defluviitaleaceae bacterium]
MNEELKRASFEKRLCAFLIDHVALTVFLMIGLFGFAWDYLQTSIEYVLPVFMLVVLICYCSKDIFGGAGLGKRVMGLAVRSSEDAELTPSPFKLFLRNILTFVWPLEVIMLLCSNDKRKIGDRIAGTDVYAISQKIRPAVVIAVVISLLVVFASSLVLVVNSILRNHESYMIAIAHIESSEEVRSIVGDITRFGFFTSGSLSTNTSGFGEAVYTIRVAGEHSTMRVRDSLIELPMKAGRLLEFDIIDINCKVY